MSMNRLELWRPEAFRAKQAAMTAALEAQIFTEAL